MTTVPEVPDVPEVTVNDVFLTRRFAAPREVVWRFWTESALLATWFGPESVTVDPESVVLEPHAGGRWDLDMVDAASGARFPLRVQLRTVVPPVYLEGFVPMPSGDDDAAPAESLGVTLRAWFHDDGDTSRLVIHQGPFPPDFRDMTIAGWEESFVKIDRNLADGVAG